MLRKLLLEPPAFPEFGALQYTFLSQIAHREDFRLRLANLYEEWRVRMARNLAGDLEGRCGKKPSPRAVATLVQAVIHGLFVQRAAEPDAYDCEEVLDLFLNLLGGCLRPAAAKTPPTAAIRTRAKP